MKNYIKVGLIANPNTGKTSLFNSLTGMSLHVGNWPGKTVEKKQGTVTYQDKRIRIVDLPGTYSISPYTNEEKVARNFLLQEDPDVIVQVIDVNALERNLLLTFELLTLGKKLILAFNFNEEAKRKKVQIDYVKLKQKLELPIRQIEANTGENKEALLQKIIEIHEQERTQPSYFSSIIEDDAAISHQAVREFLKTNIRPYHKPPQRDIRTSKIDAWLLNKYTALPFFFLIIYLLFKFTFVISGPLVKGIDYLFGILGSWVLSLGLPQFWSSLLLEGIIGGVGSVLSFTPLIFILFLFITILEDSGYLARTVIMLDRIFHKFGISGQTFLPMILGFGCNVPAIMATRTIKNKKERLIAIYINSFMSCSARLPVYVLFTGIFFPNNAATVIMILYLAGILIGLVVSFFLSKLMSTKEDNALLIELPPYRWPAMKNVFKHAWYQMSMFIRKAGTLILLAVIIIWLFASFPQGVEYGSADSYLGRFGGFIAPVFEPLGFGHWSLASALVFGLVAKEIIISTLGTLHGVSTEGLREVLSTLITPLGAFSFLVFVLLYIPCLAAVAMIKKETGSWKFTFLHAASVIVIAWLVSFAVYHMGLFFI